MRSMAEACLLVVAVCLLAGCGAGAADPAEDARLWQGTWRMVSYTWNGMQPKIDMEWVVRGDRYTIRQNGQVQSDNNVFTLDPTRRHVDVVHQAVPGTNIGGSAKGIYEIHGDTLKLCYDLTGREYPMSFDAPARSWRAIFVLHREGA
jgi:uncharacterized protein (TIGR03067 family)